MLGHLTLSKVLQVRENEKKNAVLVYNQAIEKFENVATKLYQMLRKKEMAEQTVETYKETITPIDSIIEQMTYIESLNQQIISLQTAVNEAREEMELKQLLLTESHKEVKKFEKLIENRLLAEKNAQMKLDMAAMDEISIQQFISKN